MSNWETLEELLKKPLPSGGARDPFYHTQQVPKFMKRKTVLDKDYDLKLDPNRQGKISKEPNEMKDFYNFITRKKRIKSGPEVQSRLSDYDEAKKNQRVFTSISPNDEQFKGDFKHSVCPRPEIRSVSHKRRQKPEKKKNLGKLSKSKIKSEFGRVTKENIKVLIIKNSPKKCSSCGFAKCTCETAEDELISRVFDNLSRGKVMLEQVRVRKKGKLPLQMKKLYDKKIRLDPGLLRYYVGSGEVRDVLPYLRNQADKSRRYSN